MPRTLRRIAYEGGGGGGFGGPGASGLSGLEALLAPPRGGDPGRLPQRFKGSSFDAEACQEACMALAAAAQAGNSHHFGSLVTAIKLMMPMQSGSEQVLGPPRMDFDLTPEVLKWGEMDFQDGLEENTRLLQVCEAEFARLVVKHREGFRAPEVLVGGLDLAIAYLKNYALDKADALYIATEPHCMSRGLPWDVKWLQDCATLRCKQMRQPEAAVLLEEVAKRTPPHEATMRNLGTVYNQMRQFDKAKEYFDAAAEMMGEPEKEDLWNLGLVQKNKKNYAEAAPLLDQALEQWLQDDPTDYVTLAKLYDSVGSCYDEMGRHLEAVEKLKEAKLLYNISIGQESPLYGSACERLTKAYVHSGQYQEGMETLVEAFENIATKDAVHATPLFELLGIALEEVPLGKGVDVMMLAKLEVPIEAAVRNMHYRGLDQDANAGVLFERMARALLLCSIHQGDPQAQAESARRRNTARTLLVHAAPFVADAHMKGLADLSHITMLIDSQFQALDSQDALYRRSLSLGPGAAPAMSAAPAWPQPPPTRPSYNAPSAPAAPAAVGGFPGMAGGAAAGGAGYAPGGYAAPPAPARPTPPFPVGEGGAAAQSGGYASPAATPPFPVAGGAPPPAPASPWGASPGWPAAAGGAGAGQAPPRPPMPGTASTFPLR